MRILLIAICLLFCGCASRFDLIKPSDKLLKDSEGNYWIGDTYVGKQIPDAMMTLKVVRDRKFKEAQQAEIDRANRVIECNEYFEANQTQPK